MGKQLTAKDLNLDDEYEEEKEPETGKDPGEDSSEAKFKGSPEHGAIGAEAVEKQVEEQKARQKKAEEDRAAEELEKVEGKKKEGEEEEALQYKDQVAAEKAVKDAKKKISELGTKSSQQAAMIADLQKRVDEAASKAPITAPAENPWNVKRAKVGDDTITRAAAIPSPVPPQDRDDPEFDVKWTEYQKKMLEYNGKVAHVWVEGQAEISRLTVEEAKEATRNEESVRSAVDQAIKDADLGDIPDIKDIFWWKSGKVPKNIPLEDQIAQTVELCKTHVNTIRGKERERARKEKENQEDLQVLGRGSKVITKKEQETSHTMGDAQRAALERRRLRHSP